MSGLSTNNKYGLLTAKNGIQLITFSNLDELVQVVLSRHSSEFGLDKTQALVNSTLAEFKDEEREEKYQAETGRCYYCGSVLNECDCD